jgi:ceramide glucosyltransferase
MKPVRGVDAEAYENFASFCRVDYPPDRVQYLFGAIDPNDPALDLVRKLQQEFPDRQIDIVSGSKSHVDGYNRKVTNLAGMLPCAKHDLLVLCDSDMRARPDYLRAIVAPFQQGAVAGKKTVGVVTCPYRGAVVRSFAAVLEALGIGAEFIPSVLTSRALEGVSFALGSTIVLPKQVLAEIGGFEDLADELADDYQIGNRAAKRGYSVIVSTYCVDDVLGAEQFKPMWARRLRWARTVRICRPGGYAGAAVTHGIVLGLLFLLSTGFSKLGWEVLGTVVGFRFAMASGIATLTGDRNPIRYLPILPLSDLFSFALYVGSYLGNTIVWRGDRFRLQPGGKMIHLKDRETMERSIDRH